MLNRLRSLVGLLAVVAHLATPALVLCHEVDGSFQIELSLGDCCDVGVPSSGGERRSVSASSESSSCFCVQDLEWTAPAGRQKQQVDSEIPLPSIDAGRAPVERLIRSAVRPHAPEFQASGSDGPLAWIRTVVLQN